MKTTKIQDFVLPIAQRLQSVMEAKGWTPDELAHKARLHPSTVRQVLSGKVYSLHALAAVSNALGAVDPYALPLVHPVIPPSGGWTATSPPGTQKARESAAQLDAWIADPMDVALHQGAEPTDEGTDLTPNLDKRLAELKEQGTTSQQRENWAFQQGLNELTKVKAEIDRKCRPQCLVEEAFVSAKRYRKLPVEVEAWTVKELNHLATNDFWQLPQPIIDRYDQGGLVFGVLCDEGTRGIFVPTLEGSMFAAADDWIIKGVKGEFYPCKPDIFAATYQEVSE
jgi:transcriptional regulator with XRE-family HTH domain